MTLCSLKAVKRLLAKLSHKPQKALSQNFLINPETLSQIVEAAQLHNEDVILEIGPGLGVLTQALLGHVKAVVAVEKDPILAEHLTHFFESQPLSLVKGDILKTELPPLLVPHLIEGKRAKVIANIPYNITSPLIKKLLKHQDLFSSVLLMVQKELAEKLLAKPGSKDYGVFTLFVQLFSDPYIVCTVPANSFYPEPNIDSAVIHLTLQSQVDVDTEFLLTLIEKAFSHRRKKLTSNLKELAPSHDLAAALETANIPSSARAEEVSKAQFITLARALASFKTE